MKQHMFAAVAILATSSCGPSQKDVDTLNASRKADKQRFDDEVSLLDKRIDELILRIAALDAEKAEYATLMDHARKEIERLSIELQRAVDAVMAVKAVKEELERKLSSLIPLGIKVITRNGRLLVVLPGDVLFDSGKALLKADGRRVLLEFARIVSLSEKLRSERFQVCGHTDNAPYNGPYFDNMGLSQIRAREVLNVLVAPLTRRGGGLAPENWSAAGYGEWDPVEENSTPEGRQQNRRVELSVQLNAEQVLTLERTIRSSQH